jgi:CRP/FNR family transcriptional regulator, cyclic AMP receptor protein
MQYKAGERIFAEGDPSYYCYQVVRGKVDIILSPGGRREVIASLGAGEVFGEMGVIDSGPRSASAVAAEDTECVIYSAIDLLDQFEENPSTTIEVMKTMVRRLRQSNRRYSRIEAEPARMADRRPIPPRESYPLVGFDQPILDAIEEWRLRQSQPPSMSQAIRDLVELGLAAAAPPSQSAASESASGSRREGR